MTSQILKDKIRKKKYAKVKLFYASLPHPQELNLGGIYDEVYGYKKRRGTSPITIPKNVFQKYWSQVPIKERIKRTISLNDELERLFMKYNLDAINPLATPKGQEIVKSIHKHTSMSVGDVIQIGKSKRIVANRGFKKLFLGKKEFKF